MTPSYLSEAPHLRASLYETSVQIRPPDRIKIAIHVKSGLRNGIGVELVGHHVGDLRGGEDGGDKDDILLLGSLDERKESARDTERRDGAEGHLLRESFKIAVTKGASYSLGLWKTN